EAIVPVVVQPTEEADDLVARLVAPHVGVAAVQRVAGAELIVAELIGGESIGADVEPFAEEVLVAVATKQGHLVPAEELIESSGELEDAVAVGAGAAGGRAIEPRLRGVDVPEGRGGSPDGISALRAHEQ